MGKEEKEKEGEVEERGREGRRRREGEEERRGWEGGREKGEGERRSCGNGRVSACVNPKYSTKTCLRKGYCLAFLLLFFCVPVSLLLSVYLEYVKERMHGSSICEREARNTRSSEGRREWKGSLYVQS